MSEKGVIGSVLVKQFVHRLGSAVDAVGIADQPSLLPGVELGHGLDVHHEAAGVLVLQAVQRQEVDIELRWHHQHRQLGGLGVQPVVAVPQLNAARAMLSDAYRAVMPGLQGACRHQLMDDREQPCLETLLEPGRGLQLAHEFVEGHSESPMKDRRARH